MTWGREEDIKRWVEAVANDKITPTKDDIVSLATELLTEMDNYKDVLEHHGKLIQKLYDRIMVCKMNDMKPVEL